jgi:hypothetical protein
MMDTTRAIQIAVARADVLICRATVAGSPRASPWWLFGACLIVGAWFYKTTKRG